jgi:rhamnulokinase
MTADASGRQVLAGPMEATAIGNVLVQAIADGEIDGVEQARQIVSRSFPIDVYTPHDTQHWDDAFARFTSIVT